MALDRETLSEGMEERENAQRAVEDLFKIQCAVMMDLWLATHDISVSGEWMRAQLQDAFALGIHKLNPTHKYEISDWEGVETYIRPKDFLQALARRYGVPFPEG